VTAVATTRFPVELVSVTLARQGMPREEIRAVLGAEDPEAVRRHLALHRERLDERFDDERRRATRLEEMLVRRLTGERRELSPPAAPSRG
jgi:hypothetical protein